MAGANTSPRPLVWAGLVALLMGGAWAMWAHLFGDFQGAAPGESILPSPRDLDAELLAALPQPLEAEFGYVGSDACLGCHDEEHAQWHDSYHRSMTLPATSDTVVAPFDDVTLEGQDGRTYHLQTRGDQLWVDMVDPDWLREQLHRPSGFMLDHGESPRVQRRVVMTTHISTRKLMA